MSLEFDKQNLVEVLLIIRRERQNGKFISALIRFAEEHVRESNQTANIRVKPVSRATLYNYFTDLSVYDPSDDPSIDTEILASRICDENPKLVDKFYALFTPVVFDAYVRFLISNSYITSGDIQRRVTSIDDNLYFALSTFIDSRSSDKTADLRQLPGSFRVYRPSLSTPGKVLVSGALIEAGENGALRYKELMHFKNELGWRRQILDGYIMSRSGDIALITRDTNTRFLQLSILHSLLNETDQSGDTIVKLMAGSYTGITRSRPSNLFQTGIFFSRENSEILTSDDFEKLEIGKLADYGLVEREDVPQRVRDHMFE